MTTRGAGKRGRGTVSAVVLDYAVAGLVSAMVAVAILLGLRETVSDVLAFIARLVEASGQH